LNINHVCRTITFQYSHTVLTYKEYRAVSGVLTPTPSPPSECVLPPHHRRGGGRGTHSPGGGGSIFRKTPDIGLTSYSIIPLRIFNTVWPAICQFSMKQLIVLSILSRTFTYNFLYKDYFTSNTHFVSLTLSLFHCFCTFRLRIRYSR
jgi:hypothetical protein